MHIGIDTRLTHYRTGGISTYMRELVRALASLDTAAAHHFVIFHSRKGQPNPAPSFAKAALWTPCHHRWERWALSLELARFRLDVLHSPDFIPPWHGARRHVITVHDLTFLHYPQYLTADSRRYYNDQINASVKQADQILVDSSATRDDLVAMLGVPEAKIHVHLLGVDPRFHPLPPDVMPQQRATLRLPPRYLLFVGTIEPRKNITGLLQAYRLLLDRLPNAPPLLLVGRRGWLFEDTLRQVQALGLADRLHWREDIADDAMPTVYNAAEALILPSFYEGFGFPALEAMACGTVPLVSNRSSLPEVVGDVGLQFNPEDPSAIAAAIERVLTDAPWRKAVAEAGRLRARQFTWQNTARIALQAYERALLG